MKFIIKLEDCLKRKESSTNLIELSNEQKRFIEARKHETALIKWLHFEWINLKVLFDNSKIKC